MLTPVLIALVVGYVLGSLPFGYLVARAKGVNIFEEGSKSPGATNVVRVLGAKFGKPGKRIGYSVFALDALKGAVATGWPLLRLASASGGVLVPDEFRLHAAVAGLAGALLGHSFSCFTHFKGGKGVATAAGGLLVLMPIAVLIGVVVWVVTFYFSRYVSLASILAAVAVPTAAWLRREQPFLLWFTAVVGALVIIRHRANIQRLLNGTENKFVKKPSPPPPAPTSAPKS